MVAVTSIDSVSGGVVVSWPAVPSTNGSPVTNYSISIQDATGIWRTDATDCDGTTSSVISSKSCLIPMSSLVSAPFSLVLGALVSVQVTATNSVGTSSPSAANTVGAAIRTVPSSVTLITRGNDTNEVQIEADWAPLVGSATGNSPILSYSLYWDNGSGSTFLLLTDSLATTYTVEGLTSGSAYQFKVEARNIYGFGSFSPISSIVAADVPHTMSAPVTSEAASTIQVAWSAPPNGGAAIQSYEVQLYNP